MSNIIGLGVTHLADAFIEVDEVLNERGYKDVILFSHMAKLLNVRIPDNSIIYNLEPFYDSSPILNIGYLETMRRCKVYDYQRKNVEYLESIGIEANYLPYRYSPIMEKNVEQEEDIDILFFGGINARRIQLLKQLEKSGLNYKIVTYGCFGKERDELISRAKIIINVHYQDNYPLEVVRLNYLMANKRFIISERGWDEEENSIYEGGVVFCDYENLITKSIECLSNNEYRKNVAINGQKIMRNNPMRMAV